MPGPRNDDPRQYGGEPAVSKRAAKRQRRELARQREREQRRPLVRAATVCGSVGGAGIAAAAGLGLLEFEAAALWIVGPAGVAVLAMTGILVAIERTKKRKKDRMGVLGWGGWGFAVLSGLCLIAMFVLFVGWGQDSRSIMGVAVFTTVLAFGTLGYEWTKDVKGGNDINATGDTYNDATDIFN